MRTIRIGTFETNSSSTHSITMCMKEEYDKWENGELFFIKSSDEFVSEEKGKEYIRKLMINDKIDIDYANRTLTYDGKTISYDSYEDKQQKIAEFQSQEEIDKITDEELEKYVEDNFDCYEFPLSHEEYYETIEHETYYQEFTTPNDEVVVAFGYYGNDW